MSLPEGFSSCQQASSAEDGSSFMGAVVAHTIPYRINSSSWILELVIQDLFEHGPKLRSSLVCRARYGSKNAVPTDVNVGDVGIFRQMKMGHDKGRAVAMTDSGHQSEMLLFPAKTIPLPQLSTAYAGGGNSKLPYHGLHCSRDPSASERLAVIQLRANIVPFMEELRAIQQGPPLMSSKLVALKDMRPSKFCDLIGEVVKIYPKDAGSTDLYVTDYTENPALYPYPDVEDENLEDDYSYTNRQTSGWRGPPGKLTVAIRLWEFHSIVAQRDLEEGDIVFLQNVHPKTSQAGFLEGAMHADRSRSDKVCVHRCTHPGQLATISRYKQAWEQTRQAKVDARQAKKERSMNVVLKHGINLQEKAATKKSSKAKKQARRLQKELENKEQEQRAEEDERQRLGLNPYVRAGFPEVQVSSVHEILHNPSLNIRTEDGDEFHLPFVNCKHRAHLRVVDMWPSDLRDFARCLADPEFNPQVSDEHVKVLEDRFRFSFCLLVEDLAALSRDGAPDRLILTIGNEQAQRLLKMEPSDLRNNPYMLNILQEKLFLLWGNLYERKVALREQGIELPLATDDPRLQLSNKPFECCVEEFGERIEHGDGDAKEEGDPEGWIRRFTLFETSIVQDD